jgi:hypothetical protein
VGINYYRPHLALLPEDEAARSVANGFRDATTGQMQVLPVSGGWLKAIDYAIDSEAQRLREFSSRILVILIDFDDSYPRRSDEIKNRIPADLADRIFVIGPRNEMEDLRASLGLRLSRAGQALAEDCRSESRDHWSCEQLVQNIDELDRLCEKCKDFLFLQ